MEMKIYNGKILLIFTNMCQKRQFCQLFAEKNSYFYQTIPKNPNFVKERWKKHELSQTIVEKMLNFVQESWKKCIFRQGIEENENLVKEFQEKNANFI